MYLEENLKKLNNEYNAQGISFELQGDIVKVVEGEKYLLNNKPGLKSFLRDKIDMQFNKEWLWHVGPKGMKILKSSKVKLRATNSFDFLAERLNKYIATIKEDKLRDSVTKLLQNEQRFFTLPAAKIRHHAYEHGLLEHVVQAIDIVFSVIAGCRDELIFDMDLLVAGCILHDIGKINSYEFKDGMIETTITEREQGHIINGIKIVAEYIKTEKLDQLIHIIASHHNIIEWGSPVKPNSNEAWLIHFAENLSSKMLG